MIEAEIVPEIALRCGTWELFLGMPIHQAIEIFKRLEGVITNIDVWYSEKSPFDFDILLHLTNDGLKLHFDPRWQRLKLIEITDLSKISLRYLSHHVNASAQAPTLATAINVFGSTKQFSPDEEPGYFRLCYRGLTFFASCAHDMDVVGAAGSEETTSSPSSTIGSTTLTELGAATSETEEEQLVVRRIFIFPGQNVDEAKVPPQIPASCYHGNIFLERLLVVHANERTAKLCFDLVCQELSTIPPVEPGLRRFSSCVAFGDSTQAIDPGYVRFKQFNFNAGAIVLSHAFNFSSTHLLALFPHSQDVLSALGSPSRVYYKTEDKMMIHLPQSYRKMRQQRCDYFYNYFTLGVDILFDARTHRVVTFVLHTNQPGEYTFNMQVATPVYYRCMFEIPLSITSDQGEIKSVVIDPFVKIQSLLEGVINEQPVVIHQEAAARRNPFGVTNAYNYRDLIFEVSLSFTCDRVARALGYTVLQAIVTSWWWLEVLKWTLSILSEDWLEVYPDAVPTLMVFQVLPQNGYLASVTIYSLPEKAAS
ncbi:unnamed protein product [Taenia asiatica]|uniref:SHR-BD domain-containing protein n=1 Tax=Taenia asiatica TaxID=60517 RepID=A0A158R9K4_TAEAS|nr:unnamed protein product [Taenia asiatica]